MTIRSSESRVELLAPNLELRMPRTCPSSIPIVALCLSLLGWGCGSASAPTALNSASAGGSGSPLAPSSRNSASAQKLTCDASLNPPRDNAFAYRIRGHRCEGLYVKDVGSTDLRVVSFTEIVEDFDTRSGEDLLVRWPAFGDGDTHVRAESLKPRHFYRMDTIVAAGSTLYSWPTDLLAAFDLKKDELAMLAWTRHAVGGKENDAYLPVRVQQRTEANPMDRNSVYTVVLMAGVELVEVMYSLRGVEPDGRFGPFVQEKQVLQEHGYYPAGRGFKVPIPVSDLKAGRVYLLEVGATRKDGGPAAIGFRFVHVG
ncbi:hypothetical protein WME97_41260 [Sorangium sp. So ce367]|uniref:hypothetical protein n=1 Tax=Sorangium sp. So ce367 TaxID=3133305 RepID=UPI003F64682E